ncbi:hypothetical protein BCR44DRAFT_172248 [Catenaria anguillulae PL171]|uniref:Uncharacterized protein n=1 Tax=Catenaria anguillulae PL171 TaxID=765915 RepID=A0A1Y2HYZ4_9FUNG|nr:hypothetical protein BCR44DRAFT_172248 [Catenaria anguillulae PL171]
MQSARSRHLRLNEHVHLTQRMPDDTHALSVTGWSSLTLNLERVRLGHTGGQATGSSIRGGGGRLWTHGDGRGEEKWNWRRKRRECLVGNVSRIGIDDRINPQTRAGDKSGRGTRALKWHTARVCTIDCEDAFSASFPQAHNQCENNLVRHWSHHHGHVPHSTLLFAI